jgi:hypothetical protein
MRRVKVYPLIRETHLHTEDENVQEACDRLVQVLMRDEEGEGEPEPEEKQTEPPVPVNEDDKVVELF